MFLCWLENISALFSMKKLRVFVLSIFVFSQKIKNGVSFEYEKAFTFALCSISNFMFSKLDFEHNSMSNDLLFLSISSLSFGFPSSKKLIQQ